MRFQLSAREAPRESGLRPDHRSSDFLRDLDGTLIGAVRLTSVLGFCRKMLGRGLKKRWYKGATIAAATL